jgi:hypothetical protein
MHHMTFTLNINFPALDSLVGYLQGAQQKQIDALASQVTELTKGLHQSSSELHGSVDSNK